MKHLVLKFGLIQGVLLSTYCLSTVPFMTAESDMSNSELIGNLAMFLSFFAVLYIGIKKYRDHELNGSISYGKIFVKGLLITMIACVLYSLTWTVFTAVSDINFGEIYTEMTIKQMQSDGASDEDITKTIEEMQKFMPYYEMPAVKFVITFFEPLFPGLLATLILGFVLRKKGDSIEGSITAGSN